MKKKRIVHICLSCFYVDNMGYQENILPKKHYQQGHIVEIITSQHSFNPDGSTLIRNVGSYLNENGIPVVVLPYQRLLGKLSTYMHCVAGLYKELEKFKPDIIFCHGISFVSIYSVKRYCRSHDVTLYCDCHSDYYNTPTDKGKYLLINGIFWPKVAQSVVKQCRIAWGVTPARCDYLKKVYKYPESKVKLLVMGGDDDYIHLNKRNEIKNRICSEYDINLDSFIISTGGKICKEKRVIEFLKACVPIRQNISIIVFGSVDKEVEVEFYQLLEKNKCVKYIGWAKQELIYDIFISSDLVVFPGTHSVLWEQAVSCGVPCIFRERDMMKHIDVGGNCIFLDDGKVETIHHALTTVLDNPHLYKQMKDVAINKGVSYFSYSSIAKRSIEEE